MSNFSSFKCWRIKVLNAKLCLPPPILLMGLRQGTLVGREKSHAKNSVECILQSRTEETWHGLLKVWHHIASTMENTALQNHCTLAWCVSLLRVNHDHLTNQREACKLQLKKHAKWWWRSVDSACLSMLTLDARTTVLETGYQQWCSNIHKPCAITHCQRSLCPFQHVSIIRDVLKNLLLSDNSQIRGTKS